VFYRHDPVDTRLDATADDLSYIASAACSSPAASLCDSRRAIFTGLWNARAASGTAWWMSITRYVLENPVKRDSRYDWPPFVDVLIGNELELTIVRRERSRRAVRNCARRGAMLVSKLETTARVVPPRSLWARRSCVRVVSTIGAGESFASGFLFGLVRGMPVIECLHYGNAAAAIVVSRLSCSEAMPTLGEVDQIIREQRGMPAPSR
jgi:5-dehydro-2-deoxygluconokinase